MPERLLRLSHHLRITLGHTGPGTPFVIDMLTRERSPAQLGFLSYGKLERTTVSCASTLPCLQPAHLYPYGVQPDRSFEIIFTLSLCFCCTDNLNIYQDKPTHHNIHSQLTTQCLTKKQCMAGTARPATRKGCLRGCFLVSLGCLPSLVCICKPLALHGSSCLHPHKPQT